MFIAALGPLETQIADEILSTMWQETQGAFLSHNLMMLKMSVMSIVCCSIFILICIIAYVSNYINILCCISSVEADS